MKMNKKLISLSALLLSLSMSNTVLACSEHMNHSSGHWVERVTEKLNLNQEQKAKIKVISEKATIELQPIRSQLRELRHESNQLLTAANLDESKLDKLINQEKDLLGKMIKIRDMEKRDVSVVLTTEQRAKFSEMMQNWEKKQEANKK